MVELDLLKPVRRFKYNLTKKKWRNKNPEKVLIYRKRWGELSKLLDRKRTNRQRENLFKLIGEKCVRCGFSDKRALQFDHVNGGGRQRNLNKTYRQIMKDIRDNSELFQTLCANCNWIKRHENKEYN